MENNINTDKDYSALYSSEASEYISNADISSEELVLINKGRTKAKVLGIIYLIFCGINILKAIPDLSEGLAYWIGEMAAMILFTALGVMFIKGKNSARIVLGVLFCISTAISLLILIPSDIIYFKAEFNIVALLVAAVSTLIPLGICGALIWFTLLDKSVKAYCKSKKSSDK